MKVNDEGSLKSKFATYSEIFSDQDLLKLTAVHHSNKHDYSFVVLLIEMLYRDSKCVPFLSKRRGCEMMSTKDRSTLEDMFRIRTKHFANDDLDYLVRSQEKTINRYVSNALCTERRKKNKESSAEE